MTGKEQQIDLNGDDNQVVPHPLEERTMVATSADVYILVKNLFSVNSFLFCVASGSRAQAGCSQLS